MHILFDSKTSIKSRVVVIAPVKKSAKKKIVVLSYHEHDRLPPTTLKFPNKVGYKTSGPTRHIFFAGMAAL